MKRIKAWLISGGLLLGSGLVLLAQPSFSTVVSLGTVDIGPLRQASGLAASRNNDRVLWTHNDAGDGARIFALDVTGQSLGTYQLNGFSQTDYEDIAFGPGPVTNVLYLFLGDIGDNNAGRNSIVVYQIPEPAVYPGQAASPPTRNLKGVRAIELTYPDGPRNAEAMLVDPITGDLFIASKEPGLSRIYTATRAQLDAGSPIVLTFVREIAFDVASGAAISPAGDEIILRQENLARLWQRAPGQNVGAALGGAPVDIPVVGTPTEENGEAIGFDPLGRGYYTLSDSTGTQPLYYFERVSPLVIPAPQALVSAGAAWRYLDTGIAPVGAWRTNGFNDTGWKNGVAQFGYGDGDETTVVGFGGSSNNKFITTWFRKSFVVTNTTAARLQLKLLFDDGAAAYLNGSPVALANLPANPASNTLATALQEGLEDTWFTFELDPALLVLGTNTLAVEVHQAALNSPDLSFDAQLIAWPKPRPFIRSILRQPDGRLQLAMSGGSALTVQCSTNFIDWTPLTTVALTNGAGVFTDTNAAADARRFYRLIE